jgi:hypothetical protein
VEGRQIFEQQKTSPRVAKDQKSYERLLYLEHPETACTRVTDRRQPFNNDAIEPPSELHRHAKIDKR